MKNKKTGQEKATSLDVQDWITVTETPYVGFNGYDHLESSVNIIKYREVQQKGNYFISLFLTKHHFIQKERGQVGDQGVLIKNEKKIFFLIQKKQPHSSFHKRNSG